MKKTGKLLILLCALCLTSFGVKAVELTSLSWSSVCTGGMGEEWYGSDEARKLADILLDTQKDTGGWMKNLEFHTMSATELAAEKSKKSEHSCLDNTATTQEIRFLAKVWKKAKDEKYRTAIIKAINMIFDSEKQNGGWSQYWPLSEDGSYQNYITFNDDLVINVMKLLRDVNNNGGDFADLADESMRSRCQSSFDRAIDMIIKCQIDDNGIKSAWCAQHDPVDLLPAVGRPHELPSVSGMESAKMLSFLMSISEPSQQLQGAITSAVKWFDAHKIEGKAVEDFTNAQGQSDRRIIDKAGSSLWGRFIQLGGETGKATYEKFFKMLGDRGKKRSYTYNGQTYTYTEEEIARASYRPEKEYQPVFAIYKDEYPHLYYRFLYNYEDTDPVIDEKGCQVATSLMATNRASYQYVGSWLQNVIDVEYPQWKRRIEAANEAGEATMHELSNNTYVESSEDGQTYKFNNEITITNTKDKKYSKGNNNTVKYSAGVEYVINIPDGKKVVKVAFDGYDNYDADAYLSDLAGMTYGATDYVFPAKIDGTAQNVSHVIDLSANPVSGNLPFKVASKQCCLIITLYCVDAQAGIDEINEEKSSGTRKIIENGRVVIIKDGRKYNLLGQDITDLTVR